MKNGRLTNFMSARSHQQSGPKETISQQRLSWNSVIAPQQLSIVMDDI